MLYLHSINAALNAMMKMDNEVILIGEDLLDPYGGAFKISKGLSSEYPKQVLSTPISESAIVGMGIGMAMRGLKPVVEIMFGDFLSLAADQIINHATKYNWMFNGKVQVPLVIRAPMGAGRGYGPTHSQSLESLFMSVSGLTICAPSIYHDPGRLITHAVLAEKSPVLYIENKGSYANSLQIEPSEMKDNLNRTVLKTKGLNETLLISLYPSENADVVIITYGGMAELATQAAVDLFIEEELLVHVVAPAQIRPIPIDSLLPPIAKSGRVLILEEGNKIGGWGAEVASHIQEEMFSHLRVPIERIGANDNPIPSALPLESQVLPTKEKLINKVKKMIRRVN